MTFLYKLKVSTRRNTQKKRILSYPTKNKKDNKRQKMTGESSASSTTEKKETTAGVESRETEYVEDDASPANAGAAAAGEKNSNISKDRIILWPPPLKIGSFDPSQKKDVTKEEREKLTKLMIELLESFRQQSPRQRLVIVTGETVHYRSAARSVPTKSEDSINGYEIGCAYGDCLQVLSKRCQSVSGSDKSIECITRLKQRFPKLHAEVLDCFTETEKLAIALKDVTVCCLDIGGDRHGKAVLDLVGGALKYIPILIVKARIIYNSGVKVDPQKIEKWWNHLCESRGSELDIPGWAKNGPKEKKQKRKM